MEHTRADAPKGYKYRRKGTEYEFATTAFIGNGVSIEDYELVTIEEYEKALKRQEDESLVAGI